MVLRTALPALLLLVLALTGCSGQPAARGAAPSSGSAPVEAAAAFYPLEFVVQRVGADRVNVEGLTPPGAEPHDLELGARQTARVVEADLLVHLGGFQPNVDAVAGQVGDRALDVAAAVPLRDSGSGPDPHLWLDPALLAQTGDAVAERLSRVDPDGAAAYRERAAGLRADLDQLDAEFRRGLSACRSSDLVVSHDAFGYLAERYDLRQVGIAGLSAEAEPSAARVREAARFARENDVTTIFFETLVSPAVARTVAEEVGARTAVLDPVEGRPETGDYLSAMRANLAALRAGLGCR